MRPEEIEEKFGVDALNKLYDVIFDRAVHDLADWILMYQSEEDIKEWLKTLAEDELEIEE